MRCPKCGWDNLNDATGCANCQADLTQTEQPQQQPEQTAHQADSYYSVPDYLTWSIVVTALCGLFSMFCCAHILLYPAIAFGIIAIVKSSRANIRRDMRDYAGAMWEANAAKTWLYWAGGLCIAGIVVGIILLILYLVFYFAMITSMLHTMPH